MSTFKTLKQINILLMLLIPCLTGCTKPKYMSKASETTELILSQYVKNMRKRCPELIPMETGGGVKNGKINLVRVPFKCQEVLQIERARELMLISIEELENTIFSSDEFRSYFDEETLASGCFGNSIIGNSGEDPNHYIKTVILFGSHIVYTTEKSPGAIAPLIDVYEETLEEARAIVNKK